MNRDMYKQFLNAKNKQRQVTANVVRVESFVQM